MGHSYDNGWDTKPKLDEARVLAPEAPPHRARKNRRKWCRGKPGVVHQPQIRMSKWGQYMLTRYGRNMTCGWSDRHQWRRVGDGWEYVPVGDWSYGCHHEYFCTECGKIFSRVLGRGCPDWKPVRPDAKCGCLSCTRRAERSAAG